MPDQDNRELLEAIRQLTQALGSSSNDMGSYRRSIVDAEEAQEGLTEEQVRAAKLERDNSLAKEKVAKEDRERADRNRRVMYDVERSLNSLKTAVMSAEASFSKYSGVLQGSKGIIDSFTQNMGFAGKAMGFLAKGALTLAEKQLKQADDALKATDSLAKMGSAGQLTTKEVLEMGRTAGYASHRIESLLKPIESLGSSIIGLGGSAAYGQKKFAEIANVGEDVRKKFRALGVSQEEYTQLTSDYLDMQVKSGQSINKPIKELQKASEEYVDNLLELSSLTGKSLDQTKKEAALANADIETKISNVMMDQKIAALKDKGLTDQAAALTKEKEVREKFLINIGTTLGDTARRQAALYLARGTYTAESAPLLQMGVPMEKFAAALKRGEDVGDNFVDTYARATDENIKNLGYAGMYSESLRKATNMNDESIDYLTKTRGMTREEARKEIERLRNEAKTDEDTAQIARNLLLESELKVQQAFDELLQKTNPLIEGFNSTTIAVTALQGVVLATTAAMGLSGLLGTLRASGMGGLGAGAGIGGTVGMALGAGVVAAGVTYAAVKGTEYLANKALDERTAQKDAEIVKAHQKSADIDYNKKLSGTEYSWNQEKGGLMLDDKHVNITEAPDNIREIVSEVAEERRKQRLSAKKMAIGGLLGSNQMAMVGEAGPEFITGPAKVVGVKETENLLSTVLRNGLGPFTTSNKSSSSRATDALLERNMRDLNDQKEKELEVLDESNTSMADMSVKTKGLSDTFKEFQDVLRDIFGMPDEGIFGTSAGDNPPGGSGGYPRGGPVDPATVAKASKSERGKKAIDYFKEQGWSQEQAAGIVANLMVESGANLQETAVGDRGKAYGIAQWHPDRQAIFKREYGKDIKESSFEEQLKFVQYELQNNEYLAGHRLKQTTSGGEAAYSFDKEYERSSGKHRNLRIAIAEGILEAIKEAKVSEQVAQTSPTAPVATEQNNTTREQNQLMSMNTQAFSTFSDKLSVMIAKLEENNALLNNVKQNTA